MVLGLFVLFYIKEPGRGVFDFRDQFKDKEVKQLEKKSSIENEEALPAQIFDDDDDLDTRSPVKKFTDALYDVYKNPVTRWVTIGGCFRFWETFSIVYYLPAFF